MTTDLTENFKVAHARAATWSVAAFLAELRPLLDRLGLRVDWDGAAGESWVRLLDRDNQLAALIWNRAPLGFVLESLDPAVVSELSAGGLLVTATVDFDTREYALAPDAMRIALSGGDWPAEVSPERMSIQDLWWATT